MKLFLQGDDNKLTVRQALKIILGATVFVSGTAALCLLCYFHVQELEKQSERFRIVAIVQKCLSGKALRTAYLAELLDLSADQQANLYRFNIDEAHHRLLASPVIKFAEIKKIEPGTLQIEYSLFSPFAAIQDVANTACDEEGHFFPLRPFYPDSVLTELRLGLTEDQLAWGNKVEGTKFQWAKKILKQFAGPWSLQGLGLSRLDVSKADARSMGTREIVLCCSDSLLPETHLWMLRLYPDTFDEQMERFFSLRRRWASEGIEGIKEWSDKKVVLDLRIPQLAFFY